MLDKLKKDAAERKKNKGDDGTTVGGSTGATDDDPPMPPPAKYAGPAPNGMGQDPELSEWVSMSLCHGDT